VVAGVRRLEVVGEAAIDVGLFVDGPGGILCRTWAAMTLIRTSRAEAAWKREGEAGGVSPAGLTIGFAIITFML